MINFAINKDITLDLLRKDVKIVITYENERKKSQNLYNENGDRILRFLYDEDSIIKLKQKSIFENGLKTGHINYDEFDNKVSFGKLELNHLGQIIARYYNDKLEEQFYYNELGQLVKTIFPNTKAYTLYEYDDKNMVIKQISIRGRNSNLSFGGPNKKSTTFENDDFGNIIVMKVYDAQSNKILGTQRNTINKQGDEIKSITESNDGSFSSEETYEYEYDHKNNWIIKRTLNKNNIVISTEKRQISYYTEKDFNIDESEIKQNWEYKSKRLNGQRLALLNIALSRRLFQRPIKGQLYYHCIGDDRSCILYFSKDYYIKLKKSINKAFENGKFAQSNAESDWEDLKYAIDSAKISDSINIEDFALYSIYDE